jgi:hypothetical protein
MNEDEFTSRERGLLGKTWMEFRALLADAQHVDQVVAGEIPEDEN